VKRAARIFFFLALAGAGLVRAKELTAYRAGETAEADIAAPVALDVVNPEAAAARKAAEAARIPAIFVDFPHAATNALAADFQTAFAATRTRFLAAVAKTFQKPVLDETNVTTPEFVGLVANFNEQNPAFPVPANLAEQWARGGGGEETEAAWLGRMLKLLHRPVYARELPAGFVAGDTLRFISVTRPDEMPSLAEALQSGKFIPATNLTTLARVQMLFRHSFLKSEQPLASALATFLQPVCAPAVALTQAARDQAGHDLVAADHYDAGQIIVHRGAIIDEKALIALKQLAARLPAPPPVSPPPKPAPDNRLVVALGIFSAIIIAAILAAWRLLSLRKPVVAPIRVDLASALPPGISPQINQAVKDALAQELVVQRRNLLAGQQAAAAELAELARRLEAVQTPLLDRLRIYEQRIQELEEELGEQTRGNRELLKLKIEMIRSQLEIERNRVNFN
jgi:hypothetical protein